MLKKLLFYSITSLAVSFSTVLFSITMAQTEIQPKSHNLTIVYGASMSEIYQDQERGGLPQLKTILDTIRETDKNVLFIHGGGALGPGMLSTIDKGAHMISLLNMLQPTVMAVARADFSHQEDQLSKRTYEAGFPLLNCNVFDPATQKGIEGVYPNLLVNAGGIKIGLLAVVHPDVLQDYLIKRIKLKSMAESVQENATILRQQGAEIIILEGDFSLQEFNQYFSNPPVDMVLLNQQPGPPSLSRRGNSFFELKGYAGYAAVIEPRITDSVAGTNWTATGKLVDLKEYPADNKVQEAVDSYLSRLSDMLDQKIGITHTRLDTTREAVRTSENSFANFITDTLRDVYKSDIALINGGAIRGDKLYKEGSPLTWGDMQKEFPYNNRVLHLRIKGKNLIRALEHGLGAIEKRKGRFPHISGINVEYNPANPSGSRVQSVLFNEHPLDPEKFYTLTTVDYLAGGGDGYSMLKEAEHIIKIGEARLLWEYAKDRIIEVEEISPVTDGRMKATPHTDSNNRK